MLRYVPYGDVVVEVHIALLVEEAFQLSKGGLVVSDMQLAIVSCKPALAFVNIFFFLLPQEVLDGLLCTRRLALLEPLRRRQGLLRGEHLHLVACVQPIAYGRRLGVDFGTYAVHSQGGMYGIGEVEHRAAAGQHNGLAGGREKVYLFGV